MNNNVKKKGLGRRLSCCFQDVGRKQPYGRGQTAGGLLCHRAESDGMAVQAGAV